MCLSHNIIRSDVIKKLNEIDFHAQRTNIQKGKSTNRTQVLHKF